MGSLLLTKDEEPCPPPRPPPGLRAPGVRLVGWVVIEIICYHNHPFRHLDHSGDVDSDGDGIKDAEDDDDDNDGLLDVNDEDDDGDGILDVDEDLDEDGLPNSGDASI